jgi:hypothetical protein
MDSERVIWLAMRRGFLLIVKAIERESRRRQGSVFLGEVRRGLLIICAAIEEACKAAELV